MNINVYSFGFNEVLVIESNDKNLEKLKYLHNMNWSRAINDYYKTNMYLSELPFCDYTDNKGTYISTFYFIDAEKINRIKYFLRENKDKNIDILCPKELEEKIKKELPSAKFIPIDPEKYIDKEIRIYD